MSCCFLLHGIEKLEPNLVFFLLFKGGKIPRMKLGLKKDVYLRNLLVSLKNSHFSLYLKKIQQLQLKMYTDFFMASLGMVPDGLLNFFSLVELRRAFFLQCHSLNIGMVCLETYQ